MRRIMLPALLATGLLAAAHAATAEEVVVVAAEKYAFVPAEITIRPGTRARENRRTHFQSACRYSRLRSSDRNSPFLQTTHQNPSLMLTDSNSSETARQTPG